MGTISLVKYEFKKEKMNSLYADYEKAMKSDSKDKSKFPDFLYTQTIKDIKRVKTTLDTEKKNTYTERGLVNEIIDKLKRSKSIDKIKKVNPDNSKALEDYVKQSFATILSQKLDKWNIREITFSEQTGYLQFSLTIDSFEIVEFKDNFTAIPSSYFATIILEPHQDYIIAYIIGNPTNASLFRSFIKQLLKDYKMQIIRWDDQALRKIKEDLSSNLFGLKAKNVEARVTVDAHSENLDNTKIYGDIEAGSFASITYQMKDLYGGNSISINGFYGTIKSDISDDELINYIKEKLLNYSSITHTTQDSQ